MPAEQQGEKGNGGPQHQGVGEAEVSIRPAHRRAERVAQRLHRHHEPGSTAIPASVIATATSDGLGASIR